MIVCSEYCLFKGVADHTHMWSYYNTRSYMTSFMLHHSLLLRVGKVEIRTDIIRCYE